MRVFRVLWPLISLPMMLSFCYIYNATRSFGSTMWRSAAKCGATFVAVITAVLGIVLFNRPANAWLLALALLFCCIADFVIERDFRFGVISFGLAHLVLIGYIAQLGGFRWGTVVAALIIYGIIALIFRQYLHSLGSMLLPMVLYPLVLSFMTAMAGTLPFAVSTRGYCSRWVQRRSAFRTCSLRGISSRHYGHTEKRCADPILPRRVRDGVDTALFVKLFWGNLNGTNFEKYIGK